MVSHSSHLTSGPRSCAIRALHPCERKLTTPAQPAWRAHAQALHQLHPPTPRPTVLASNHHHPSRLHAPLLETALDLLQRHAPHGFLDEFSLLGFQLLIRKLWHIARLALGLRLAFDV